MKRNKIDNPDRRKKILLAIGLLALLAIAVGLGIAYSRLREISLEPCVVTDMERQVSITDGKMVRADVVASELGLRNGSNLSLIDFKERREYILKKIPNIRDIRITRQLPDKVTVLVEERIPIAKLNFVGNRNITGRVVDNEGVVFETLRGTQTLPTIREAARPGTSKGDRIGGRVLAALRLIELCRENYREFGVLEADASKPDYILITLSSYSQAKVAWSGMDNPTDTTIPDLVGRLDNLKKAIDAAIGSGIQMWNATQSGRVYADNMKGTL